MILQQIDDFTSYSYPFILQIFNNVIEKSERSEVLQIRLEILHREITLSVYRNVSRGLFERHKLVFSFLLNIAIYLNDKLVAPAQWNFILRGASGTKVVSIQFQFKWEMAKELSNTLWLLHNVLGVGRKNIVQILPHVVFYGVNPFFLILVSIKWDVNSKNNKTLRIIGNNKFGFSI